MDRYIPALVLGVLVASAAILVGSNGCGGGSTAPSTPTEDAGPRASSDGGSADGGVRPANACEAVSGVTFISQHDLPIGENQQGIVYGRWLLVFEPPNDVCWGHEDVAHDDGTYTCDGWSLSGSFYGYEASGQYDASAAVLTWDGDTYVDIRSTTETSGYCQ